MRRATLAFLLAAGSAHAYPLRDALSYPFIPSLVAAPHAPRVAWIGIVSGARNVFTADAPDFTPHQITANTADDGQELSSLTLSADGKTLLYVRGGDHDANWPDHEGKQPNPALSPAAQEVAIWSADPAGKTPPHRLAEGDFPRIAPDGHIVFLRKGAVWTMKADGSEAKQLFADRGEDTSPTLSPDGKRLAFISNRGDHAFIGIAEGADNPLRFLSPSTGTDAAPIWSPDGTKLAFVRRAPEAADIDTALGTEKRPWRVMIADAATGETRTLWTAPDTARGAYPAYAAPTLLWHGNDTVVFGNDADNWPHLYAVPASGGTATLLTPGRFMVEGAATDADGATLLYTANTGAADGDSERRHIYTLDLLGRPRAVTDGTGLEWSPVTAGGFAVFIAADARTPPHIAYRPLAGGATTHLSAPAAGPGFTTKNLVTPEIVHFTAADGMPLTGILFAPKTGPARHPAVVFVHGGPPRQMLPGWHYMDYYSNAYAVNQYLAAQGFAVLAVNYRLGIGYGHDFLEPAQAAYRGASEYQDIVAAGRYLQNRPDVDAARIGIWGGSYGGLMTAMALGRDSTLFAAGVDLEGVHDWRTDIASPALAKLGAMAPDRFRAAMDLAYRSSPVSSVDTWRSPVLLIHGDNDRNVEFGQTVDLAARLAARHVETEELVLPNEVHDMLRFENWVTTDRATIEFLTRKLK